MRPWKPIAVATALAAWSLLGPGVPEAVAGDSLIEQVGRRIGIRLKRFQIGYLEAGTDEFVAQNGPGAVDCLRDAVLMFEFSGPINLTRVAPIDFLPTIVDAFGNVFPNPDYDPNPDFVHLNDRTIRIGVAAGPDLFSPAEGSFQQHSVRQYNPVSGQYDPKRTYRNRILFDPTKRLDAPDRRNPAGFEAYSEYTVILPGRDSASGPTVRSRSGRPLLRTFTTTFRTGDAYRLDFYQPSVVGIEATDAPGVPLDRRVDVGSSAGIVATFSEPMLPASVVAGSSFLVRDDLSGLDVPGTLALSPDGMVCTFLPDTGFGRGPAYINVTLTQGLKDLVGNYLRSQVTARFATEPAAPGPIE